MWKSVQREQLEISNSLENRKVETQFRGQRSQSAASAQVHAAARFTTVMVTLYVEPPNFPPMSQPLRQVQYQTRTHYSQVVKVH